jgi:hypothetical protein
MRLNASDTVAAAALVVEPEPEDLEVGEDEPDAKADKKTSAKQQKKVDKK